MAKKTEYHFVNLEKLHETADISESNFDYNGEDAKFLKTIRDLKKNSLVGLIGQYGTGKTVFLKEVESLSETITPKIRWIHFDAWKFPERKNLWEGFILEYARQLSGEKQQKKIKKELEGKSSRSAWVDIATDVVEIFAGVDAGILDKLSNTIASSKATEVFEFEAMLTSLIESTPEEEIMVVVEDVDRSSDYGIFFLETLKNFLDRTPLNKKIEFIVPIAPESVKDRFDAYLKCLDYQEIFIGVHGTTERFVDSFWEGDNDEEKKNLVEFLAMLQKHTSLRLVKFILRKAEIKCQQIAKISKTVPYWGICLGLVGEQMAVIGMDDNHKNNAKNDIRNSFIKNMLCTNTEFPHGAIVDGKKASTEFSLGVFQYQFHSSPNIDGKCVLRRPFSNRPGDPHFDYTFMIPQIYRTCQDHQF